MGHGVQKPVAIQLPDYGIRVAESAHGAGFRMGAEEHDFHQLYVVQRGRVMLEDERLETPVFLEVGSVWPIPAGTAHRMEDSAESILLLACIEERHLRRASGRARVWERLANVTGDPLVPDPTSFSLVVTGLNRILAEQWQQHAGHDILIAAELDQLLVRLLRSPPGGRYDTAEDRVQRVIAALDTDFFQPWNIDRAAAQAHLSRRRFTALFRQATGQTFNAYLTSVRIRHAMALLRGGHHSVAGAAFASGMSDVSHFYRVFKRHTGRTPAEWTAGSQWKP